MADLIALVLGSSQSLSQALESLESSENIDKLQEKVKCFQSFAERFNQLPTVTASDIVELKPPVYIYCKACGAFTAQIAQRHSLSSTNFQDWFTECQGYLEIHMNTLHIVLFKIFSPDSLSKNQESIKITIANLQDLIKAWSGMDENEASQQEMIHWAKDCVDICTRIYSTLQGSNRASSSS